MNNILISHKVFYLNYHIINLFEFSRSRFIIIFALKLTFFVLNFSMKKTSLNRLVGNKYLLYSFSFGIFLILFDFLN